MTIRSSFGIDAPATATCRTCGQTVPAATSRVTGVWSAVAEHATWDCETCARTHIRDIEAGLNRTHW